MKALYEITTRTGKHLCYQVASNEKDAVSFAQMYGFKKASKAVFIRND